MFQHKAFPYTLVIKITFYIFNLKVVILIYVKIIKYIIVKVEWVKNLTRFEKGTVSDISLEQLWITNVMLKSIQLRVNKPFKL